MATVTATISAPGGLDTTWPVLYNQMVNCSGAGVFTSTYEIIRDVGFFNGQSAPLVFVISGTGFTYTGNYPNLFLVGGTVTGIQERDLSGNVLATITGFDFSVSAMNEAVETYKAGYYATGTPDPSGFDAIFHSYQYSVTGGPGSDKIQGGNLNDVFFASTGNDSIEGGGGADTMSYSSLSTSGIVASVTSFGGIGGDNSVLSVNKGGSNGADTLTNVQNIVGSAGNDVLSGLRNGVLTGGAGSDVFYFDATSPPLGQPGLLDTITDLSWATGAVGQNDRIHIAGLTDPTQVKATIFAGDTYLSVPNPVGSPGEIKIAGERTALLAVEFASTVTPAANLGSLLTQNLANETLAYFDVANIYNWSSTFTTYNAAGQAATGDTYYDIGSNAGGRDHTTYDPTNAQPYSSVVDTYNAANQQTAQAGNRDDAGFAGFTWQTLFDPNNIQTYANFTNTYEPAAAGGAVFQQSLTYDPGQTYGSSFTQYDPLSQQSYSFYQNFYLPGGTLQSQNGLYDAGALAGDSWITTYATDNQQTYSSFTNTYNASSQVLSQVGFYNGGAYSGDHWVTAFTTPGSTAHYDQYIYNAAGGVVAHNVV